MAGVSSRDTGRASHHEQKLLHALEPKGQREMQQSALDLLKVYLQDEKLRAERNFGSLKALTVYASVCSMCKNNL